jgi:PAS domain S-box-containing protein
MDRSNTIQVLHNKIPWHLILIFIVLSFAIAFTGYFFYQNQKKHIKEDKQNELSAIAGLKIKQITNWREERMRDASFIFNNEKIAKQIENLEKTPVSLELRKEILSWMTAMHKNLQYTSMRLVNSKGKILISVPEGMLTISAYVKANMIEALRSRKILFSDLYRDEDKNIYLHIIIPILNTQKQTLMPVGAVILRINPHEFLYPLLQSWPIPSSTAETLMIRRDGDDALFLNEVRHRKNTALSLRVSLSKKDVPAAKAARGETGIFEGKDYRGIPVLAAIQPLPGFPWFMVAKVDMEEVFAPFRVRFRLIILLIIILIGITGLSIGFIWRNREAEFYRKEIEEHKRTEKSLLEGQQQLRKVIDGLGPQTFVGLMTPDGIVIEANRPALEAAGLKPEDVLGKPVEDTYWWTYSDVVRRRLREAVQLAAKGTPVRYDEQIQVAEGQFIWLDFSMQPLRDENGKIAFLVPSGNVITERKQAEEKIRESKAQMELAVKASNIGPWDWNLRTDKVYFSPEWKRQIGYEDAEILNDLSEWQSRVHPDDLDRMLTTVNNYIKNPWPNYEVEFRFRHKDGSYRWILARAQVFQDADGKPYRMIGTHLDITERKRAEEKIARLTRLYTVLSKINEAIVRIHKPQKLYEEVCKIAVEDGNFRMVWIGFVDPETLFIKPVAHYGYEEGYLDNLRLSINPDIPEGRGPTGSAVREGRYFVCNDIKNDPHMLPWREEALKRGYLSSSAFPLKIGERILGVINFYLSEPFFFKEEEEEEEVKLLTALADDLSFAIETMENEGKRNLAEETLRQALKRIRTFIDADIVGVVIASPSGGVIEANDYYLRMIGYTREEFEQGMVDWRSITPPEWLPADEHAIEELREKGICTPYEKEYVRRDGTRVSVFLSDAMLPGTEEQIAAFVLDITERKQSEALIQKERDFSTSIINSLPGVLYLYDENLKFLRWNKNFERVTGYTGEEISRMSPLDFFTGTDKDLLETRIREVFTRGSSDVEADFVTSDGTRIPYYFTGLITYIEGSRCLVGVGIDITERKKTEEELRMHRERLEELVKQRTAQLEKINHELVEEGKKRAAAMESLKAYAEEIRDLYNNAPCGYHSLDADGTFLRINDTELKWLGFPREEIIGKKRFSDIISPESLKVFESNFPRFKQQGRIDNLEFDLITRNGEIMHVLLNATAIKDSSGKFQMSRSTLFDITELQKARNAITSLNNDLSARARELEQANIRLQELDRLKSMFVASMSHELRTPLNSIIGFTGLILQGMVGSITEEQRDMLQRSYNSSKHLLALISDVIDISKIEAGKIEPYIEEFRLDDVINEAVSNLRPEVDKKGLLLETDIPKDIHLKTDRRRLLQCILNYLSNAVKFTEKGSVRITAHLVNLLKSDDYSLSTDGNFVEISVEDSGIGIKEEDIPRLFESFVRLDSHLKVITLGTGLGLYLTKKLAAEVLQGEVAAKSTHGQGSVFVLRIPKEI